MPTEDEIRQGQRASWSKFSAGWEKWDHVIMAQLAPVGAAMIDRLAISEDQQHLDIASGTGEPALSIAALAPRGRVVLTDLAPEMLEVAKRRASAQGITNIETRECSGDDLPFADAAFDSVSIRFGFMFFPDLAKATAELVRVLKPGGRISAAVWTAPERNPWTMIPMAAVAAEIEMPPPDPNAPSMFRCGEPGAISDLFQGAGLRDVSEWDVVIEQVTESPEQYWEIVSDIMAPVVGALEAADAATRQRIESSIIDKARPFATDGRLRLTGVARCIVGTK